MHWAYEVAHELIRKNPNKETFVCASGISPSGSVHIGNFREIVTTYFVVKALQDLGKKTRFIFSWDDYDRFRKVPQNIDPSFARYLGMPYSDIPDPYGCHDSYAEHFEKEFEKSLQAFGIEVEFIYQHAEYRSGRYNEKILESLYKRKEIYDIVMNFKMEQLYPICYHENKKVMKENQKQLFSILYKLIINQSSGPRIPLLIHVVGIKKFISLLDF